MKATTTNQILHPSPLTAAFITADTRRRTEPLTRHSPLATVFPNSLQTGRCIWTLLWDATPKLRKHVSIPFKREGVSGRDHQTEGTAVGLGFQFPSNGKVYLDWITRYFRETLDDVSIPFKREGVSGRDHQTEGTAVGLGFQFPSNGKVYLDWITRYFRETLDDVSIPFKREGVSGRVPPDLQGLRIEVSIPFKREGVSGLVKVVGCQAI